MLHPSPFITAVLVFRLTTKGVIFTTQAEMRVQKCQAIPALSGYVFFLSFMVVALVRSPRELSFFSFLTENAMALRSRHVPFFQCVIFRTIDLWTRSLLNNGRPLCIIERLQIPFVETAKGADVTARPRDFASQPGAATGKQ